MYKFPLLVIQYTFLVVIFRITAFYEKSNILFYGVQFCNQNSF